MTRLHFRILAFLCWARNYSAGDGDDGSFSQSGSTIPVPFLESCNVGFS